MDRISFKKNYLKRTVITVVLTAVIGGITVMYIIRPGISKAAQFNADINVLNTKLKEYNDFNSVASRYEEDEKKVEKLVSDFRENLISRAKVQEEFLDTIGEIAKKAGIKIENITPVGSSFDSKSGYEKQVWEFRFFTGYPNLVAFLNLLERNRMFFGVDKLIVSSAKDKPEHRVQMSVYTIVPSSLDFSSVKVSYEVNESTDIFGIPDLAMKMAARITREIPEIGKGAVKWDPMLYEDTLFPEEKKKKKEKDEIIMQPSLKLEGVIWDEVNPMVVVNGKVIGKGDTIEEARVVSITRTGVTLNWRGRLIKLKSK